MPPIMFTEVVSPHDRWCASGHSAPATFARRGPGTGQEQTKFYRASGVSSEVSGVYCEPCVIVASAMGGKRKRAAR